MSSWVGNLGRPPYVIPCGSAGLKKGETAVTAQTVYAILAANALVPKERQIHNTTYTYKPLFLAGIVSFIHIFRRKRWDTRLMLSC